jgi:hypothetical protein
VKWAEGYYGDYRPVVKVEVLRWLEERSEFSTCFIDGLRIMVRDSYSNQYRMPPDIAILERYRNQATYDAGRKALQIASERTERKAIEGGGV